LDQPHYPDRPYLCQGCNVILISLDTLRADHLSSYGYPIRTSPEIDRLAEGGIIFRNAFSPSSWTYPSHAVMLTSLNEKAFRKTPTDNGLDDSLILLPEVLKFGGYVTGGFTGGGWLSRENGFGQGFDVFNSDPKSLEDGINQTLRFIDGHKGDRFFVFFHTYRIHCPYETPQGYDRFYTGPLKGVNYYPCGQNYTSGEPTYVSLSLQPEGVRRLISIYDANIWYTDMEIGRIFSLIKGLNISDRTIVIITSDHGDEFMEHGRVGHGTTLYDELIHVPLMIVVPSGARKNASENEQVGTIDITPTILDILNITPMSRMDGRSLVPWIIGEKADYGPVFGQLYQGDIGPHRIYYVRDEGRKYIVDEQGGAEELYDILSDPHEQNNLDALEPRIAHELRLKVRGWLEENEGAHGSNEKDANLKNGTREQLKALGYIS
jgi:choline-sulfatase